MRKCCVGIRSEVFTALWAISRVLLRGRSFCGSPVFSAFIFLVLLGLSLTSSCASSIFFCQLSVHSFYDHVSPIADCSSVLLPFSCTLLWLPFPSCSCIVYGVFHYGSGLLNHLILLLSAYHLSVRHRVSGSLLDPRLVRCSRSQF